MSNPFLLNSERKFPSDSRLLAGYNEQRLTALAGYDIELMEKTRDVLKEIGKPTVLQTGRRMYKVDNIPLGKVCKG